jgi:hypothetical protein
MQPGSARDEGTIQKSRKGTMHKKPFGQPIPESNGPETNRVKKAGHDAAPV